MSRIWIDVESLFQYAAVSQRPSGIQRLELEIGHALATGAGDRVGFVRHSRTGTGLYQVPFEALAALHARLSATPAASPGVPTVIETAGTAPVASDGPGRLRRLLYRLPPDLREPLATAAKGQIQVIRGFGGLRRPLAARLRARARRGRENDAVAVPDDPDAVAPASFEATVRPGDVLLMLGATWPKPEIGVFAEALRRRHGLRLGVLVYDVIPILRPEWCGLAMEKQFRHWLRTLLPQAEWLFTISAASARDLGEAAAREGVVLAAEPRVVPIGTGFGARTAGTAAGRPAWLPAPDSYALVVCTLDPRKNHALLVRVWRRLLDTLPPDAVPTLVFAGKLGPMMDDLMQILRNADWFGGKVMLVREPSDAEVEALYRGCRFTLFPSFYEGWGLPVTESLGFGRPCLISNASSLPEAGGALARYFDPEDGNEAYRVVREAIEDRDGTAAWAERVRAEFRPVPWTAAAAAILGALDDDEPVREAATAAALPD